MKWKAIGKHLCNVLGGFHGVDERLFEEKLLCVRTLLDRANSKNKHRHDETQNYARMPVRQLTNQIHTPKNGADRTQHIVMDTCISSTLWMAAQCVIKLERLPSPFWQATKSSTLNTSALVRYKSPQPSWGSSLNFEAPNTLDTLTRWLFEHGDIKIL
jgi:hypothetical protein